ncbi:hypothetical protein ES319_D05G423800v1 [Gossypium barbadense]|uniref:Pentacotripeptide-repeat region of PRORP domain-containing protein n=2 Tax=Gossypium barbadense TaxID=3634 RepID=A0A5J5RWT7_GOSBA|nr:hypothetical protein ES319_D05G423800v1 [Gossypium barbadense]
MTTLSHPLPIKFPINSPTSTHSTTFKSLILCKKRNNDTAFEEHKSGFVDYDKGQHEVSTRVSGLRKAHIPKRYRLRVEGDRFQKDWTISDVVDRVLEVNHWENVDPVLNRWVGRFARKNFPFLIKELTQRGAIEHGIKVFEWMKKQKNYCARTDIYNMMIRLHARHKRTDQARGLFFEMQKWRCKPDVDTYNALIHAHGQVGQWRWAMNIMEDMLSAAIPPSRSTYNNLINACGSSGNWREALKVCKKMTENGVGPDLVTHNIVLSAYKSGAQYSKALSYFELMKGTHIRPDTTTLNIVINCLVKLGQYGKAMDIFNSMRDERADSRPDIVTFTSIIHLYSVCGQIENCKAVFSAMLAEAEAVEVLRQMEQEGIKPNIVSICTLLAACGRCRQKVNIDAVLSAAELRCIKLNTVAYNSAIGSYMNVGEFEKAIALYKSMRKRKVLADSVTYTVLISGSYKLSRYSEALGFLDDMVGLKIPLTKEVYSSLICVYSKQGQVAEAESMFNMMKVSGCCPDVVAYTAMLHAYNSAENWAKASAIFLEMEENGIQPDSIACCALLRAFNKGGQPSKVLVLAKYMREKAIPLNDAVFFEMVSACSILQDWKTTIDLIKLMEPWFPLVSIGLLNQLLNLLGKSGKIESMMKLFYKIIASGVPVSFNTYSILLKNLLAAENWRKYIEVLQWMEDSGIQPSKGMFVDIVSFSQKRCGVEYADKIKEKVGKLKLFLP